MRNWKFYLGRKIEIVGRDNLFLPACIFVDVEGRTVRYDQVFWRVFRKGKSWRV